jgi:hypothetical protein
MHFCWSIIDIFLILKCFKHIRCSPASYHNSSPQTNGQLPPSGPLNRGHSLNRPQTVHESQQNNIYFSIDDNKQSENRPENHYARVQRIERPKSVPPNMFEALQKFVDGLMNDHDLMVH